MILQEQGFTIPFAERLAKLEAYRRENEGNPFMLRQIDKTIAKVKAAQAKHPDVKPLKNPPRGETRARLAKMRAELIRENQEREMENEITARDEGVAERLNDALRGPARPKQADIEWALTRGSIDVGTANRLINKMHGIDNLRELGVRVRTEPEGPYE